MRDLYRREWNRLARLRRDCRDIEREATPALCFGRWKTARVVTAGLNPSEVEFREATGGAPLAGTRQRFLHWETGELTDARLDEALRRAEGYFELGNTYARWFDKYGEFLSALGVRFENGTACHTDYVSPFASRCGISACGARTQRMLRESGEPTWLDVLNLCSGIEVLFGHGGGWRRVPRLLGLRSDWHTLPTPFDAKGGRLWTGRPHLLHAEARSRAGRPLQVYWWKPNRDGAPLCWLNREERRSLGSLIRAHAQGRGALA